MEAGRTAGKAYDLIDAMVKGADDTVSEQELAAVEHSACPTCVPARATLYTGMSQEHTGRVGYEDLIPWEYPHTLAGELSKAGYYTQCVGKMHVHPLRNNLGFNDVRLHDGYLHAYRRPTTPSYEDQRVAELRELLINALKNREEGYTDGHSLLVGKTPVTVLQHTEVL